MGPLLESAPFWRNENAGMGWVPVMGGMISGIGSTAKRQEREKNKLFMNA
jgi:hypothetical protein